MWWVYIPAIVVEGKGIIEAFGRSRELTRGRRWHLLGLILIVVIILLIGQLCRWKSTAGCDGRWAAAGTIIQYVFIAVLTAFNAVLVAVSYYYLRAEKEGMDANEIARIFD